LKLLTKRIIRQLPPLDSHDRQTPDKIIIPCHFFLADSIWDWYPFEFDGKGTFFGLTKGLENELGYFTLDFIHSVRSSMGFRVERDLYFKNRTLEEVMKNRF